MKTTFIATNNSFLYVHYKMTGGLYNVHPVDLAAMVAGNPGKRVTCDPFDTQAVRPGESWSLPEGAVFIDER